MASLRNTVKDYQDELKDGIAWVAFWREGVHGTPTISIWSRTTRYKPLTGAAWKKSREADPAAVMLNSYYCGHLGEDMNL